MAGPHLPSHCLENFIECCLCNERFDDQKRVPKILTCGHEYCLECIDKLAWKEVEHQSIKFAADCPKCRATTYLPGTSSSLTTVYTLLSAIEDFSKHCNGEGKTDGGDAVVCECGERFNVESFNYCEFCDETVCDRCAWRKHRSHQDQCHSVDDYLQDLRSRVKTLSEQKAQTLASLQARLDKYTNRQDTVREAAAEASNAVRRQFAEMRAYLDAREAEMLSVIKTYEDRQFSALEERQQTIVTEVSKLAHSLSLMNELVSEKEDSALIGMRKQVADILALKDEELRVDEVPGVEELLYIRFIPSNDVLQKTSELPFGLLRTEEDNDTVHEQDITESPKPLITYSRRFLLSLRDSPLARVEPRWINVEPCVYHLGSIHKHRRYEPFSPDPLRAHTGRRRLKPPVTGEDASMSTMRNGADHDISSPGYISGCHFVVVNDWS